MALFDANGYDPKLFQGAGLPGYAGGNTAPLQATPQRTIETPRFAPTYGSSGTAGTSSGTTPVVPGTTPIGTPVLGPTRPSNVGPVDQAIAFASNPYGASPEYGGNLSPGDPGRKAWQQWVGNTDNWIQREMGMGNYITGAPNQFQGDINNLNAYGTYGLNPNGTVPIGQRLGNPLSQRPGYQGPLTLPSTETRPASQGEMDALHQYQNFLQNNPNALGAWGGYQRSGQPGGGQYSAYMANQAMQGGWSPTSYAAGARSSDPGGFVGGGNYQSNNNQLFNQFGIPIGTAGGAPSAPSAAPASSALPPTPPAGPSATAPNGGYIPFPEAEEQQHIHAGGTPRFGIPVGFDPAASFGYPRPPIDEGGGGGQGFRRLFDSQGG